MVSFYLVLWAMFLVPLCIGFFFGAGFMSKLRPLNDYKRLIVVLLQMVSWPNTSVKGTRRTQALVNLGVYFRLAGFINLCHPARPLLLRWTAQTLSFSLAIQQSTT